MASISDQFLLDPDVVFLNHGSFGATPRPVFEEYQRWQRTLERQPVQFLAGDIRQYLAEARAALSAYVNVAPEDIVYIPNATFGVNAVARSLSLGPGDEVLATDHEYGACERVWQFLSGKRGFTYRRSPIAIPLTTAEDIIEQFWQGVTPRTKVIFLSHITSPTAVRFPVETICARAREAGILTIIDGAHAPGQIPLDLAAIGADCYTGNCHKWLCAPKGSAFLYVRREVQKLIEPLVIGWGWNADPAMSFGSDFLDYYQYLGTNDLSAYLAVPAAIRFQADNNWPAVVETCHDLLTAAISHVDRLTGLPPIYPTEPNFYRQMGLASLPSGINVVDFKNRLYRDYRVEVPCFEWQGQPFIRISIQAYNTEADVDALVNALKHLFVDFHHHP